ncbi:hypothetical protein BP5796_00821 [Coleophoma crateriformis]|uniref:GIY-YIG domain-containing protein n=1 Tax=Coleophoma crateriformis TaxID=565419 RepID=A0A3D8TB39_9HELO|nr:hypothetical protein BP5796_00821 [Coleophoma crateriformis]
MPLDRPIPAFYCCYLLRSTVTKTGTLYIGSTPNPVRRLRQHNGVAKGGAVKTSKKSLRPWEMTCIVTGFPSQIAALQFEWAWQNPHITTHIPPESRISNSTQKKASGHPKRLRLTLTSGLSNLHLLLRVPSFSRWPLEIRFFTEDVHKAWLKWDRQVTAPIPDTIPVMIDFPASKDPGPVQDGKRLDHGIDAIDIDYISQKPHVEKGKQIVDFEQEGSCSICSAVLEHDLGMYTICPTQGCQAVTHLTCLSKQFLADDDEDAMVPTSGNCPKCKVKMPWVDVMKELTLRLRGQKEVEKLLKVKRIRKKQITASQTLVEGSDPDDEAEYEKLEEEIRRLQKLNPELGESYLDFEASDDSDTGSVVSNATQKSSPKDRAATTKKPRPPVVVIEDSDWDDAEVLDSS